MTVIKKITTFLLFCSIIAGICCLSPSKEALAASKPGTPEISLEATADGKGIRVYIFPTKNTSGYRVYMKKPEASKYSIVKTFKNDGSASCIHTISELGKGTYTVCVKAYSNASGKKVWCSLSKKIKITIGETDPKVDAYLEKNYPGIKKLADKGLVGINAEYKPDTIVLGKWDMDMFDPKEEWYFPDGKKENLEWQVLDYSEDGKSALVISKYVICIKEFYDVYCNPSVKWEDSAVYTWLKGEFYEKAFTKSEKSLIKDEITVLSASEAERYFKNNQERIGQTIDGSLLAWGLKSFSEDGTLYAMVAEGGGLYYDEGPGNIGVRPVFNIKLTSDIIKANKLSIGNKYGKEIEKVYVTLGSFDMEDAEGNTDNNKETLEWEILDQDKKNGTALLLSRYLISNKEYTDGSDKTMWEKSPVRKWLNEDFYNSAFSDKEKNLIQKTVINNNDSADYNVKKGNDTIDRVFILSPYEFYKYYNVDNDSWDFLPGIAAYSDGNAGFWHLRHSYVEGDYSPYVFTLGCPVTDSTSVGEAGIRPVVVITTDPDKKQDNSKPDIPEFGLESSDDGSIVVKIKNDNADGYRIFMKAPNETKYTAVKTLKKKNGESTVFTLTNKPYGEYYFQVKAYKNAGGKKVWSKSLDKVSIDHERPEGVFIRSKEFLDALVTQYAKENNPELYKLAEKGCFSLSEQLKSYNTIKLGSWKPEDRDGKALSKKKQDIEWEILEYSKDGKSALVISKNILCFRPYDSNKQYLATWDDSTIRKWLNEDFFNSAFTKEEQKLILNETVKEINLGLKGKDTEDRIFLLSDKELKKYLTDLKARSADGKYSEWWVRTVAKSATAYSYIDDICDIDEWYGYYGQYAVLENGTIDNDELDSDTALGIRPAFRIELTDEIISENNLVFGDDIKPEVEDIYIETKRGYYTDTWIMLDHDEKEQKALLLCTEYIEETAYEEDKDEITWEESTLREYLNGYLYGSLPESFRKLIIKTKLVNEDNEQYGTNGGNDTEDYVFILSASEYKKYLAPGSGNEKYLDLLRSEEDYYYNSIKWWLRTPGSSPAKALYTDNSGTTDSLNMEGRDIDDEIFAYPVVWISLNPDNP